MTACKGTPATTCAMIGTLGLACTFVVAAVGCRRPEEVSATPPGTFTSIAPGHSEVLSFPAEFRSDNEAVNDFVTRSMKVSAAGDYEAFRLLWSVHDEPISQQEFMEGWRAVREIRVKALRKVRLTHEHPAPGSQTSPATGDRGSEGPGESGPSPAPASTEPTTRGDISHIAYALFAEVAFDPARTSATQENPRQLALLVVPEKDQWRLARPPKQMKSWLREQLALLSLKAEPSQPPTAGQTDAGLTDAGNAP